MASEKDLDRLEQDIKQLRIDYERFFAGAVETPPEELRQRLLMRIRSLRSSKLQGAVLQFRLGSLEARLNSYSELYSRRLRDQELGVSARSRADDEASRHDPASGVVVSGKAESKAVEALYSGLQSGDRGPKFDLETFRVYIEKQVATIRQKTGCREVQFRVAEEGGKMKLKAKPVVPS